VNIWQGSNVQNTDAVTVYDSPLRVTIYSVRHGEIVLYADDIERLAIATSSHLGTACVIHLRNDDSSELLVIEAAPPEDIRGGRHLAALRAATEAINMEIDLERAWNSETERTTELLNHLRRSFTAAPRRRGS
jgi:hypothetical protein